jgi:hypothetical protein
MPLMPTGGDSFSKSLITTGNGSDNAGLDSLESRNYEERIKALEGVINELKRLPSSTSRSYQSASYTSAPSNKNDAGIAASSTAQKRAHDQISNRDDELSLSSSRIRTENTTPTMLDPQSRLAQPLYNPIRQPARESGTLKRDLPWSQFPPRLKNCTRGNCFLPSPDEGYSLVSEYLHDFNSILPLFHPESIYRHVRACYSGEADETHRLYWVLAYVTLGIGHRLRAMSLFATPEDTPNGDFYLNKCLDVLPDLLLQEPSLQLVQALLGVSVLLQTSYRSRKAALFVTTAMHMAQDLGYNEAASGQEQKSLNEQQGFYVFWIAFVMDTAMSLGANRSTTQRLADIGVPLPNAHSSDWWALNTFDNHATAWKVNILTLHANLALIQAECSDELFSVSARQRSATLTAATFDSLVSKLDTWKVANPLTDINASSMLATMYQSDIVHSVILEASYFETLYRLHASNGLGGFDQRRDVFSASSLKVAAGRICFDLFADAQRLLELAGLISQGNLSVTW